jgi:hypothetical protein
MQLHKRHTVDQVRMVLDWYTKGIVTRTEAQDKLGLKRRRFFEILKTYRAGKLTSIVANRTNTHRRISGNVEAAIKTELIKDKHLIDNPAVIVSSYTLHK